MSLLNSPDAQTPIIKIKIKKEILWDSMTGNAKEKNFFAVINKIK